MSAYKVLVDDNFHYMDDDERWEYGSFPTPEEAIEACRTVVDTSLLDEYRDGATAEQLYDRYLSFGDEPFVVAPENATKVVFSARAYARQRVQDLADSGPAGSQLRDLIRGRRNTMTGKRR